MNILKGKITNIHIIDETPERQCRACGCTDLYCPQCIAATAKPCHWVEADLCSRCALEHAEKKCLDHPCRTDTCDDLHQYMDAWGRWNWTEVAREGRRLWNAMFKDEIEHNSPQDGLIAAVAAQAADGVFAAVAAMLDLEKDDLMNLVMPWYHDQDQRPAPVSPEILADYIRHTLLEREPHEFILTGTLNDFPAEVLSR